MADPTPQTPAPESSSKSNIIELILPLLNTIAILGTMGFAAYTKLIYKRAQILETTERVRLEQLNTLAKEKPEPAFVKFGPLTVNIAPTTSNTLPTDGTEQRPTDTKLHYLTLSFALEIRDGTEAASIETIRPRFLDRINQVLGKLSFQEMSSAQGRYLVQSRFIDLANELLSHEGEPHSELVTHVYFTQFMVQ